MGTIDVEKLRKELERWMQYHETCALCYEDYGNPTSRWEWGVKKGLEEAIEVLDELARES